MSSTEKKSLFVKDCYSRHALPFLCSCFLCFSLKLFCFFSGFWPLVTYIYLSIFGPLGIPTKPLVYPISSITKSSQMMLMQPTTATRQQRLLKNQDENNKGTLSLPSKENVATAPSTLQDHLLYLTMHEAEEQEEDEGGCCR